MNFTVEGTATGRLIVNPESKCRAVHLPLPGKVAMTLMVLKRHGHQAYVVGGAVRDLLLGRTPADYDIATTALPTDVLDLFAGSTPTGLAYGTVTIPSIDFPEGIQVTTFREDLGESDGRRPEVVKFGTSLFKDAARRDSTINALYYDGAWLLDPFGGENDLNDKIIRAVGDPVERLHEDKLRALRYIRQATQLDFGIARKTWASISLMPSSSWQSIASEAAQAELNKILLSDHPAAGLGLLSETLGFEALLPELAEQVGYDQRNPHHRFSLWEHTLHAVMNTPARLHVRLSALLHDVGKPATQTIDADGIGHYYHHHVESQEIAGRILERLRYPSNTQETVSILVREHMARYPHLRGSGASVKRLIRRVGAENCQDLIDLMVADAVSAKPPFRLEQIFTLKAEIDRIIEEGEPLTVKDLVVNGRDLMDLGIEPGPKMGEILRELLELVLERPEQNNREALLYILEARYGNV